MQNIVLAFDSFKGTLTAQELCNIAESALKQTLPEVSTRKFPVSDGGEGITDAFLKVVGGKEHYAIVTGPFGEPVRAKYAVLNDDKAIIEMAQCAGLTLIGSNKNPLKAGTYGVGELILDAVSHGAKKLILGLGGSATNDCGIGMAAALGYRFLDQNGACLAPMTENMGRIKKILAPKSLVEIDVIAACDVDNPLYGPDGATYTFSAQKGADAEMMEMLENGIINISRVIERDIMRNVSFVSGAGAAGGLGAGVMAFLNGALTPGIELLLDAIEFDSYVKAADLVLTGEGRIDWQTAHGKVPVGIANRSKRYNKPCVALCGSIGDNARDVYNCGIDAIFSSVNRICEWRELKSTSAEDFRLLVENVGRFIRVVSQ